MDIFQKDGKLICQKYSHNEPIMMVAMENSLPIQERLLCVKCLQLNRNIQKIIGIEQVKEMIKEKENQMKLKDQQQRLRDIQIIKEFQSKMIHIQTQMMKDFEQIQRITQQWIKKYEEREGEAQLISLIKGIEMLNQQYENDQSNKINQSYSNKLESVVTKLINNAINKPFDILKQLQYNYQKSIKVQQINQNIQSQPQYGQQYEYLNISEIKLINSVKQEEFCYAIAFNNNGQIIVTGCEKYIKVWKFQKGQIKENLKFNGHTNDVYCLVFSKKVNWFASGSYKTINGWKEQTNGEWISTQPKQQHTHWINCLLLNRNEDQLISCSGDNTIKLWKVDCLNNQLDYYYTLDNRHTDSVNCISMNEQETYLVSCSEDKKIILWNKDNQNKWKYLNEIINDDSGRRLCFISDCQIIWQQQGEGITHFFEIINEKLIKNPSLNIQLNQESDIFDLFPTIFNKGKQIIVEKHNRYVYFLRKLVNDKLTLISDPIDCNDPANYGALSEDGEYFIIWNYGSLEFRVQKIYFK